MRIGTKVVCIKDYNNSSSFKKDEIYVIVKITQYGRVSRISFKDENDPRLKDPNYKGSLLAHIYNEDIANHFMDLSEFRDIRIDEILHEDTI